MRTKPGFRTQDNLVWVLIMTQLTKHKHKMEDRHVNAHRKP